MNWLYRLALTLLGLTLLLSGLSKAVDPLGFSYKLTEYLAALNVHGVAQWLPITAAVALSAAEATLGACLLSGWQRRFTSAVSLALMAVMTAITVWLVIADPVSDCGCFGDLIHLTNAETLTKNVVLTICAIAVTARPTRLWQACKYAGAAATVTAATAIAISAYGLYYLPVLDFRPYHTGADLIAGMTVPDDAPSTEYSTTFILEKDGHRQEFTLDNYPDSTWTFVSRNTVVTAQGYTPPIHDFSIVDCDTGDDITSAVLHRDGYTMLMISQHLEQADQGLAKEINALHRAATSLGIAFYCLTASTDDAIDTWRHATGSAYPFCNTDETTLRTIIRSNPGLLLLRHGTIVAKWSRHNLPTVSAMQDFLK